MTVRTLHLSTPRLDLRRFTIDDSEACFREWMSDPEVAAFTSWSPHADPGETRAVISSWVEEYRLGSMDWCIVWAETNRPIGSITAVQDHRAEGWCEIGYCLSQDYWDMGIMTEALTAVSRFIFDFTDYTFIQARFDTENEASGRVLEKCNYKSAGERDLPDPKTGRIRTYRFMRLMRSDVMLFPD